MKLTLHKLKEGFVVTSDEEIRLKDLAYNKYSNKFNTANESNLFSIQEHWRKVVAKEAEIDFSSLSEEEQKEIGWFDVDKLALDIYPITQFEDEFDYRFRMGFNEGFRKAQELLSDRVFTMEDIEKAFRAGERNGIYVQGGSYDTNDAFDWADYKQSLSKPKSWAIEVEMEEYTEEETGSELKWMNKRSKFTNGKIKILRIL